MNHADQDTLIAAIISKYIRQQELTLAELQHLDQWVQKHSANSQLLEELADTYSLAQQIVQYKKTDTATAFDRFIHTLHRKKRVRTLRIWSYSAAAVLLVALSISFFLIQHHKTPEENSISTSIVQNDILPGTNRATLILSNGKTINLDEQKQEIIMGDSSLNYGDGTTLATTVNIETALLKTPRAGQYDIVLPDGTKVSLNAESSLEYPVRFTGSERRVKLTGEAYFEVTHDKSKPFHVETKNQDVQVLGTVFNIRSYRTKEFTTLLSGKVMVKNNATKQSALLMPGQNVTATATLLSVQNVDIQDYVSWKKGFIGGSSVTLQEILAEIERWYDVTVIIDPNLNNSEKALLSINRQEKLSVVLNSISAMYGVNYQIKGKEVYIRHK